MLATARSSLSWKSKIFENVIRCSFSTSPAPQCVRIVACLLGTSPGKSSCITAWCWMGMHRPMLCLALVDLRMAGKIDLTGWDVLELQRTESYQGQACSTSLAGRDPRYFHRASSSSKNLRSQTHGALYKKPCATTSCVSACASAALPLQEAPPPLVRHLPPGKTHQSLQCNLLPPPASRCLPVLSPPSTPHVHLHTPRQLKGTPLLGRPPKEPATWRPTCHLAMASAFKVSNQIDFQVLRVAG